MQWSVYELDICTVRGAMINLDKYTSFLNHVPQPAAADLVLSHLTEIDSSAPPAQEELCFISQKFQIDSYANELTRDGDDHWAWTWTRWERWPISIWVIKIWVILGLRIHLVGQVLFHGSGWVDLGSPRPLKTCDQVSLIYLRQLLYSSSIARTRWAWDCPKKKFISFL